MPDATLLSLNKLTGFINEIASPCEFENYVSTQARYNDLALLSADLSHDLTQLKQNLSRQQYERLMHYILLTEQEQATIKVKWQEKLASLGQTITLGLTAIIGIGLSFVGFFGASLYTMGSIDLILGLLGAGTSSALAYFSVKPSKHTAEMIIDEKKLRKIRLLLLQRISDWQEQAINKSSVIMARYIHAFQLDNLIEDYSQLIKNTQPEKSIWLEDIFLTKTGLSFFVTALKKQTYTILGQDVSSCRQLQTEFDQLEDLVHQCSDFSLSGTRQSGQNEGEIITCSYHKVSWPVRKKVPLAIDADAPIPQFSFSDWQNENKISVRSDAAKTFLKTMAGNMVIPSYLLAVGTILKSSAMIPFIVAGAAAVTNPIGIGIVIGFAVTLSIALTIGTVYNRYRSHQRQYELEKTKKRIEIQQTLNEENDRKYHILNKLKDTISSLAKKMDVNTDQALTKQQKNNRLSHSLTNASFFNSRQSQFLRFPKKISYYQSLRHLSRKNLFSKTYQEKKLNYNNHHNLALMRRL